MSEYTFNDLIANPETPDLESLIGKEVYYSNVLLRCVAQANEDIEVGVLRGIHKDDYLPFLVQTSNGKGSRNYACFACIIPKRKEKPEPKYVPFKDSKEFIRAYKNDPGCLDEEDSYLFKHGMWLKEKKRSGVYCMVAEIWNCGVDVSGNRISNEKDAVIKDFTTWENLYLGYTFLDGSPCGKVEDINV